MELVEWREAGGELRPFREGQEVVWAPQEGSQQAFLECPVQEVLLEGPRATGKTETLLMDFLQHVGSGMGAEWRGILFRKTYKQLKDVEAKTKKWFRRIHLSATFNSTDMAWRWPTGEELLFKYMERPVDYWNYHGWKIPWIAWEELTTWPDDKCYKLMMSCCQAPRFGVPIKYRATTNSYGPGMNWVKSRFQLPVLPDKLYGPVRREPTEAGRELTRVAIHSCLEENKVLLHADPGYIDRLSANAPNPSARKAWVDGSWDIVAGGMFDDLWDPRHHVVPNLPLKKIPRTWRVNRSYDYGQSRPFSVGWWAESNGEPLELGDRVYGEVPGDLFRVAEWYGWTGQPNEGLRMLSTDVADGIVEREEDWGIRARVRPGPADSSIFDDFEPGKSVAGDMESRGVRWTKADKGPGSRVQGWTQLRKMLAGAIPGAEGVRERPGLFVCQRCTEFIRTVPVLPRSDKNLEDVDTDAEDHVGDEVRYRLRERRQKVRRQSW